MWVSVGAVEPLLRCSAARCLCDLGTPLNSLSVSSVDGGAAQPRSEGNCRD